MLIEVVWTKLYFSPSDDMSYLQNSRSDADADADTTLPAFLPNLSQVWLMTSPVELLWKIIISAPRMLNNLDASNHMEFYTWVTNYLSLLYPQDSLA